MTTQTRPIISSIIQPKEFLSPALLLGMLAVIFMAAFALNFTMLSTYAAEVMKKGLVGQEYVEYAQRSILPFFFPLLVDLFLIMATLIVLRNSSVGESSYLAWSTIIATTIIAVTLNGLHYNVHELWLAENYAKLVGVGIYALSVPGAILLTSELGKGLMNSVQKRNNFAQTTATLEELKIQAESQLEEITSQMQSQKDELKVAIERTQNVNKESVEGLESLKRQIVAAKLELQDLKQNKDKPTIEWQQAFQIDGMLAAGMKKKDVVVMMNLSPNTVRSRLQMLNGQRMSGGGG